MNGSAQMFSAGRDGIIRCHDAVSTQYIDEYATHLGWVNAFVLTGDKRTLISASNDTSLKFWRVQSPSSCLGTAFQHTDYIKAMAYSDETGLLVTGGLDKQICIWDINHIAVINALDETQPKYRHSLQNQIAALSTDSVYDAIHSIYTIDIFESLIAAGSSDGVVRLYDPRRSVEKPVACLDQHQDTVRSVLLNEHSLISGSSDNSIKHWDVRTLKVIDTLSIHEDSVWSLCRLSRDRIISAGRDQRVIETNLGTGKSTVVATSEHYILDLSVSLDHSSVWVATTSSDIVQYSLESDQKLRTISGTAGEMYYKILPKTTEILTEDAASVVSRWDVLNGVCIESFPAGTTTLKTEFNRHFEMIFVRPWYNVDLSTGKVVVTLDPSNCFDGYCYLEGDTLVNLGQLLMTKLCDDPKNVMVAQIISDTVQRIKMDKPLLPHWLIRSIEDQTVPTMPDARRIQFYLVPDHETNVTYTIQKATETERLQSILEHHRLKSVQVSCNSTILDRQLTLAAINRYIWIAKDPMVLKYTIL